MPSRISSLLRFMTSAAILLVLLSPVRAGDQDPKKILNQLRLSRQSEVPEKVQIWAANQAVEYLQARSKEKLGANLTPLQIFNQFAVDPKLLESLEWAKNPNSIETDIFTELTELFDQVALKRKINACYWSTGGREFGSQLMQGAAAYNPVCEGRWTRKIITYEYFPEKTKNLPLKPVSKRIPAGKQSRGGNRVTQTPDPEPKLRVKTETVDVPLFAWPPGFESALNASHEVLTRADFTPSPPGETPWFPSEEKIRATFGVLGRETISALQIRKDTYERTLSRNLRNKLALRARYRRDPNHSSILALADQIVASDCTLCSPDQRGRVLTRLRREAAHDESIGMTAPTNASAVRKSLCDSLRAENYPFDAEIKTAEVKAYGNPKGSLHNAQIEQAGFRATAVSDALHNRRRTILARMVKQGGDNLLILTKKMTELTENQPGNINLKCDPKSASDDEAVVTAAVKAALSDTDGLRKELEDKANPARALTELDDQNADLLMLSPKTFGEALMRNSVDGSDYTCKLVEKISRKDINDQEHELMAMWGIGFSALILGPIALVEAGSLLSYGALAAGTLVGGTYGVDQIDKAIESKDLAEELRRNAIGLGGDDWILKQSDKAWSNYQSQKWTAIITLGLLPLEWVGVLNRAAAVTAREIDNVGRIEVNGDRLVANIQIEVEKLEKQALTPKLSMETEIPSRTVTENKISAAKDLPVSNGDPLPIKPTIDNPLRGKGAPFKEWKITQVKSLPADTNAKFLKMTQREVESAVKSSEIKAIHPIKGGGQSKAYIVELDNGMVGIYKPDAKFQPMRDARISVNAKNEIVSSAVDEFYAFGSTPKTVGDNVYIYVGHKGMTDGSFQLIHPGALGGDEFIAAGGTLNKQSAVKADLFDSIIDQGDRSLENFLVNPDGTLVTMDNGKTFANGEAHYNKAFDNGARKPGYTVEKRLDNLKSVKIEKLTPDGRPDEYLSFALRNHYSDADVVEFFKGTEGKNLIQKLETSNQKTIQDYLQANVPNLSTRELSVYSARIMKRSELLLDYAKSMLAKGK